MKILLITVIFSILIIPSCFAQEIDTVFLKDGSIIKGKIIDVRYTPEMQIDIIKIEISGGNIIELIGDQISYIQRGQSPAPKFQPNKLKQITKRKKSWCCMYPIACSFSRYRAILQ